MHQILKLILYMDEPSINIGILTSEQISFDLYGDFTSTGLSKKISGRYIARLDNDKIIVEQEGKIILSGREILITPNEWETESFLLRDVVIGKNFHWEKKENQRFRGELKLIKEGKNITAVNIVFLEEYLTSVVSSEMNANSSLQLLKAHAIISRGWLIAQLEKKQNNNSQKFVNEFITESEIIRWYDREDHANYDFCADDHCQRYQGVTKIINDNAVNAVESTRGLVLTYDNKICDTRYSKCCGGMSEGFENVWEPVKHHYLAPIVDYKFELDGIDYDLTQEIPAQHWIKSNPHAFCNTSDKKILSQILPDFDRETSNFFRWQIEYRQDELTEIIKTKSGIDFGNIIELVPVERGYSGRINKLKIIGDKKVLTIGKELEIRKTLSNTHLYSSAFIVTKEYSSGKIPAKFILRGAGWGHGVGLCQIGAAVMGARGYDFDAILLHYFKAAKIQKIY